MSNTGDDYTGCSEGSGGSQTVIGIILGLAGSICINTGNNYQSLGTHNLEVAAIEKLLAEGKEAVLHPEIEPSKSPTWIFGTVVFICGSALNFTSFPFASTSVLAPLEAIQFVSNVIWGKLLFGKVITDKMIIGTFITIFGVVMVLGMGPKEKPEEEKPIRLLDFVYLWRSSLWIGYLVFCLVFGTALFFLYKSMQAKDELAAANHDTRISPIQMGVTYAMLSGIIGSHMMISIKIVSGITFTGCPVFTSGEWWGFWIGELVAFVAFMIPWLVRLNSSLILFDPIMIVPLVQSNFIVWAIIGGGIYFQDFTNMEFSTRGSENWIGFFMGIMFIFFGIYLLSPSDYKEEGEENIDTEDTNRLSTDLRLSLSPADYIPENEEVDGDVEGGQDAEGLGLSSSGLKGKQLFKAAVNAHMIKSSLEKDADERTQLEKVNKLRHDLSGTATRVLMPSIARVNHQNLKVKRAVMARTYSEAVMPDAINRAASSRSLQSPSSSQKAKLGRSYSEGHRSIVLPAVSAVTLKALRSNSDDGLDVETDQISIEMTDANPDKASRNTTENLPGRDAAMSSDLGAASEDTGEIKDLMGDEGGEDSTTSNTTELSTRGEESVVSANL
mmetsp:Transcript_55576/g.153357  ORF Transcript_55576/g.153357 Transcript_55576/m.153357 type:complete len:613 (+) Transcript_55576:185-2023(+)